MENLILQNKEGIVQKVRDRWKKGLRPDGAIIGTYASFAYQQEKARLNPEAEGNVDLILTGALVGGLTLNRVLKATFTIFSTDSKAVMIAEKYGLDVYGLNEEEKRTVLDMVALEALNVITNKVWAHV